VHDTTQLERHGIPAVVLGTTAFIEAAAEQYAALGFAQGSFVAVAHPLGSMPLERVLAEAERAVEPVLAALLRGQDGGRRTEGGRRRVEGGGGRENGTKGPAASATRSPKPAPVGAVVHTCSGSADEEDT
jgi:hypothetical protein